MTKNQIEYLKLRETQRANLKQEQLTEMRDTAAKDLGFATLGETQRHNMANETHQVNVLGETKRHNLASEAVEQFKAQEIQRHNIAGEQLESAKLDETSRHNMVTEGQTSRSLDIQHANVTESMRHNQVVETESHRSNVEREAETRRSNLAREQETTRSNMAREAETSRHNIADEQLRLSGLGIQASQVAVQRELGLGNIALGYANLSEQERSHLASETETNRANVAKEQELTRSNKQKERLNRLSIETQRQTASSKLREERRHNEEMEKVYGDRNFISAADLIAGRIDNAFRLGSGLGRNLF